MRRKPSQVGRTPGTLSRAVDRGEADLGGIMQIIRRVVVALALLSGVVALSPAAAEAAPGATTFVTMVGDGGDYISGGASRVWTDPGDVSYSLTSTRAVVSVPGLDTDFGFELTAPTGKSLAVGQYDGATRFADTRHAGIDISGDGRGCNETTGRFTVLDVDTAQDRLWVVYEQHCEGDVPAVFGEIRINEPGGDSDLLVAPGRVAWPDTYPGVAARPVPVNLVNTSTAPVTVTQATITGSQSFTIVSNGCGVIAPGELCRVYVGFTPSGAGSRSALLTIRDSTRARTHTVPLTGVGIGGHTTWAMNSQSGDYVGQGHAWSYAPGNATFRLQGNESHVRVYTEKWDADFKADSGHLLLPGTVFKGATRYPFSTASEPGLNVDGMGRGCNKLTGSFTVQQATYDAAGNVKTFAATFEQHCEGVSSALFGSVAYRAARPASVVASGLTLATDRSWYVHGADATVTATLPGESGPVPVAIYVQPDGGTETLVATGTIVGGGSFSATAHLERRTRVRVVRTDRPTTSSPAKTVTVRAQMVLELSASPAMSGATHVYPVAGDASAIGMVLPDHAGGCVHFRAEQYLDGAWVPALNSECVTLDESSVATWSVPDSLRTPGVRTRVRMDWPGDTANSAASSTWQYLRFTA